MAFTLQPLYSAGGTAITLTGTSLANNSYRQSTAVDNSTNKYADAYIYAKTKSSGTPTVNTTYTLFGYWSNDGGTTYSNNATGTDGAYTPDSQANLVPIGSVILTATASLVSYWGGMSFCRAAGLLYLPQRWGVILLNTSGVALSSTAADTAVTYQGVNLQGN